MFKFLNFFVRTLFLGLREQYYIPCIVNICYFIVFLFEYIVVTCKKREMPLIPLCIWKEKSGKILSVNIKFVFVYTCNIGFIPTIYFNR